MSDVKISKQLRAIIESSKVFNNTPAAGPESVCPAQFLLATLLTVEDDEPLVKMSSTERYFVKRTLIAILGDRAFENYTKLFLKSSIQRHKEQTAAGPMLDHYLAKAAEHSAEDEISILTLLKEIANDPPLDIKKHAEGYTPKADEDTDFSAYEAAFRSSGFAGKTVDDNKEATEEKDIETGDENKSGTLSREPKNPVVMPPNPFEESRSKRRKKTLERLVERVKEIQRTLLSQVYGQDFAISVFTAGYFQAEFSAMTDADRKKPLATFLFAGPPGVGKTFLAETAAKVLGLPFKRFDMSEFAEHILDAFSGTPKTYKDSKAGIVTSYVKENPKCVILFDEIEKAHINIINQFLQILDAGHIRDAYFEQEIQFKDTILFFTTNAGKQLYESAETTDYSGVSRKVILNALRSDVNPQTKIPYFPEALCSRFATGNVVMFNHMGAHTLLQIAEKEIKKRLTRYSDQLELCINVDPAVYSTILFAEGGHADARTVQSRAGSFIDSELYELFRLINSGKVPYTVADLERIDIGVDIPDDDEDIHELFLRKDSFDVLVFASEETCGACDLSSPKDTRIFGVQSVDVAKDVLKKQDISFVLIDIAYGSCGKGDVLNLEDVDSKGRDFFWYVKEKMPDIPVYFIEHGESSIIPEERLSFMKQGVRDVLNVDKEKEALAANIEAINKQLHQQKSMAILAKSNKVVEFETSQTVEEGGKVAGIKLFDLELKTAVDSEDSKNILSNVSKPTVRFSQVIGAEDAKSELQYFVEYLKNPKKFIGTGVNAPKGVLLYGPPGTGKTMLAKAMACESDVTFISAEGNQFHNQLVGVGRDRVKELFATARKYAPSILFIDEIDAIAKNRFSADAVTQNGSHVATLTALFTEMDGFKTDTTKPVFVLAATNADASQSSEELDPALLRRFDRRIFVDLPTREERIRFIKERIAKNPAFEISEDKINSIGIRSNGMSLALLESVVDLSLRTAIKDGNLKVTDAIFDDAFETYCGGEEKKWDESLLERTARHESGHALLYWRSGITPSYLTIVARGNHGGYMMHDDKEKEISTREEILAKIRTSLAGRAAEIVYYGEEEGTSTGASGDLENATRYATHYLCAWGMDPEFGLATVVDKAALSGGMAPEIRKAVNKILANELQKTVEIVRANKPAMDALVEKLLVENHLSGDQIKAVLEKFEIK